jgi:hypothetical protein
MTVYFDTLRPFVQTRIVGFPAAATGWYRVTKGSTPPNGIKYDIRQTFTMDTAAIYRTSCQVLHLSIEDGRHPTSGVTKTFQNMHVPVVGTYVGNLGLRLKHFKAVVATRQLMRLKLAVDESMNTHNSWAGYTPLPPSLFLS